MRRDPWRPGLWRRGTSTRSCPPRPATSWASWARRSTRWPGPSANFARPGRPAAPGTEDGAGDDRLVSRPGRRRRPSGRRRAGQPGGPPSAPGRTSSRSATTRSPGSRRLRSETAPRVGAGRPGRLPARDARPRDLPPRRRSGAVFPAPRPGDPQRFAASCSARRSCSPT